VSTPISLDVRPLAERLGVRLTDARPGTLDELLPVVNALARHGVVVLMKVDGERVADRATVVIDWPGRDNARIRRDDEDLVVALVWALSAWPGIESLTYPI
jgi:hypothetical protein